MALNAETLEALCLNGFGPLKLARDGAGYAATFDGRTAAIAIEPPAVRATARIAVEWPAPQGIAASEIDTRIAIAVQSIALSRDELSTIKADRKSGSVEVSIWISAEASDTIGFATAVRNAIGLADVAALTIDQIRSAAAVQAASVPPAVAAPPPAAAPPPIAQPVAQPAPPPVQQAPPAYQPAPPAYQPAPPPVQPATPPVQPAAIAFAPTHKAPQQGLRTWQVPDGATAEGPQIRAGLPVEIVESRPGSAWTRVKCSNGWTAWVDGRLLTQ